MKKTRIYRGIDGIERKLTYSHEVPYLVDWHVYEKDCRAEIWLDDLGYPMQIPVRAWHWVRYKDVIEPDKGYSFILDEEVGEL